MIVPDLVADRVRQLARRSLVTAVVTAVLAAAGIVGAGVLGYRASSAQVAEPVTVTVRSEGTHQERRGGRRSRRTVEVRHVDVTTADGRTGRVSSEDLQVGDTARVWRRTDGGAMSEDEPSGLGVGDVLLAGGTGLVGLVLLGVAIGSARRARRLRATDVASSPRVAFALDEEKLRAEPHRVQQRVWHLPLTVTTSEHRKVAAGSSHDLFLEPGEDPVDVSAGAPRQWEGRVLHAGLLSTVVALRTSPQAPWWVTDV
ncbi:hypothetical protein KR76_21900 [Pimelobacter simplex]|uniref:Uncharacterized protein n=1 Tax=Nocardioides simplex TaxID=2045 RepID=A0A0A1DQD1_NOCSI|nr:hypothetical protein KR76_21900 [Pimelobacter simplex]GEB14458.1 hypothetical protein NSI01_27730 [Pimelobacter simplex]